MSNITLNLTPIINLTKEQFLSLCQVNPEAKLELNANGELVIMSPTGGETGNRNLRLIQQIANWTESNGTGIAFDSSTMFELPNGSLRSPDVAWISNDKWLALTAEQRKVFPPICPDFVVELRSESDTLKSLQDKMLEYINNGTLLGWLINPQAQQVEIYRINQEKEVLQNPTHLSGEDVLPGLVLHLNNIF